MTREQFNYNLGSAIRDLRMWAKSYTRTACGKGWFKPQLHKCSREGRKRFNIFFLISHYICCGYPIRKIYAKGVIYIKQNNFRTYQRRGVTRESGYHTIEGSTGGECLVKRAQSLQITRKKTIFRFYRKDMVLIDLFDSGNGILSFGGYIHTDSPIRISFSLIYTLGKRKFAFEQDFVGPIDIDDWNNIGFTKKLVSMRVIFERGDFGYDYWVWWQCLLEFISLILALLPKLNLLVILYEKLQAETSMHILYLYYLDTVERWKVYARSTAFRNWQARCP